MKWFEHKETEIRGRWMPAPYQNVFIGSDPRDGATKEWADQFDAVINVSCTEGSLFEPSRPDQRTYWYPLNEGGQWSYAFFFMMFKIIDHHYRKGDKLYIHCHAGAYRSPSIFRNWLVACENKTLEQANEIERGKIWEDDPHMKHYSVYQNFLLGNTPPNYQEFIYRIRSEGIKDARFMCILLQPQPLNKTVQVRTRMRYKTLSLRLKNFVLAPYRKLKSKLEDLAKAIHNWKEGNIVINPRRGYYITSHDWEKKFKKMPPRKS